MSDEDNVSPSIIDAAEAILSDERALGAAIEEIDQSQLAITEELLSALRASGDFPGLPEVIDPIEGRLEYIVYLIAFYTDLYRELNHEVPDHKRELQALIISGAFSNAQEQILLEITDEFVPYAGFAFDDPVKYAAEWTEMIDQEQAKARLAATQETFRPFIEEFVDNFSILDQFRNHDDYTEIKRWLVFYASLLADSADWLPDHTSKMEYAMPVIGPIAERLGLSQDSARELLLRTLNFAEKLYFE